jgi:hypothetical protein
MTQEPIIRRDVTKLLVVHVETTRPENPRARKARDAPIQALGVALIDLGKSVVEKQARAQVNKPNAEGLGVAFEVLRANVPLMEYVPWAAWGEHAQISVRRMLRKVPFNRTMINLKHLDAVLSRLGEERGLSAAAKAWLDDPWVGEGADNWARLTAEVAIQMLWPMDGKEVGE